MDDDALPLPADELAGLTPTPRRVELSWGAVQFLGIAVVVLTVLGVVAAYFVGTMRSVSVTCSSPDDMNCHQYPYQALGWATLVVVLMLGLAAFLVLAVLHAVTHEPAGA